MRAFRGAAAGLADISLDGAGKTVDLSSVYGQSTAVYRSSLLQYGPPQRDNKLPGSAGQLQPGLSGRGHFRLLDPDHLSRRRLLF